MKDLHEELAKGLLSMSRLMKYAKPLDPETVNLWAAIIQAEGIHDGQDVEAATVRCIGKQADFPAPAEFLVHLRAVRGERLWAETARRTLQRDEVPQLPMSAEAKAELVKQMAPGAKALLAAVTGDVELAKQVKADHPDLFKGRSREIAKPEKVAYREPTDDELREAEDRRRRVMEELGG